jgi:dolichol-phosphate mannosyltransferase
VVLPVFNEAEVLDSLYVQIRHALEASCANWEIVFVNDGSSDGGGALLDRLAAADRRVRIVHLSRNFGHQAAVHAGITWATGDAVIVMDSDMQDSPTAIADFLLAWQSGHDVVYAIRYGRKESFWKKALFRSFYRFLNLISNTPIPNDAGNFGLMDRRVAETLLRMPERDRYFPGLRRWVGFRQTGIPVERGARYDGTPRVSLIGLLRLAKTAIFSFSSVPLAIFYALAAMSLAVCLGFTAFTLYHKWVTGLAIPGWSSILIVSSFFGALNALGIGILGEYMMRIYDQVRGRPPFIVARITNFDAAAHRSLEDQLLGTVTDLQNQVRVGEHAAIEEAPRTTSSAGPLNLALRPEGGSLGMAEAAPALVAEVVG